MIRRKYFLIALVFSLVFLFSYFLSNKKTSADLTNDDIIADTPVTTQANTTEIKKSFFGGKIIAGPIATEISAIDASGFICANIGTTFDIKPIGNSLPGPYLVPAGVIVKGGGIAIPPRWVIGLYNMVPIPVTCTQPETGATIAINVYSTLILGTSQL